MVQQSGGHVARDFAVLEVFRRYRDFKPQGIAELNEGGEKLADALAKEIDVVVDELILIRKEARMPELPQKKVGIIACSGEELPEGTVTRLAALRVLEQLRPG